MPQSSFEERLARLNASSDTAALRPAAPGPTVRPLRHSEGVNIALALKLVGALVAMILFAALVGGTYIMIAI